MNSDFIGWTFNPPDMPGIYSNYDGNYTATISTNISISSLAFVTLTMICTTTNPADFSVRVLSDNYSYLLDSCPQNLIGNVSADLGYYGKGIWPLTMEIQVIQGNDQFLVIGNIWLTVCEPALDYLWSLIIIPLALIAILLFCLHKRGQRGKFVALKQVDEIS